MTKAALAVTRMGSANPISAALLPVDKDLALLTAPMHMTSTDRLRLCLAFHSEDPAIVPFASRARVSAADAIEYAKANRSAFLRHLTDAETNVHLHLSVALRVEDAGPAEPQTGGREWLRARQRHMNELIERKKNVSRWLNTQLTELGISCTRTRDVRTGLSFSLRCEASRLGCTQANVMTALDLGSAPHGIVAPLLLTGPWPIFMSGSIGEENAG